MVTFDRFTDMARKVIANTQRSAWNNRQDFIASENILAGLCMEQTGIAALALTNLGVNIKALLSTAERMMTPGTAVHDDQKMNPLPFTPQAKQVLELSLAEAKAIGHPYVGTEHLLLGLADIAESQPSLIIGEAFRSVGLSTQSIRGEILDLVRSSNECWMLLGETDTGSNVPIAWVAGKHQAERAVQKLLADNPTAPYTHIRAQRVKQWDAKWETLPVETQVETEAIRSPWNTEAHRRSKQIERPPKPTRKRAQS